MLAAWNTPSAREMVRKIHSKLSLRPAESKLVIWGERVGGSESVKVKLNSVAETIEIFDVMVGEQPVEVKHNTAELSLDVSDHALILQIHKD
jgi:hypothetical protein